MAYFISQNDSSDDFSVIKTCDLCNEKNADIMLGAQGFFSPMCVDCFKNFIEGEGVDLKAVFQGYDVIKPISDKGIRFFIENNIKPIGVDYDWDEFLSENGYLEEEEEIISEAEVPQESSNEDLVEQIDNPLWKAFREFLSEKVILKKSTAIKDFLNENEAKINSLGIDMRDAQKELKDLIKKKIVDSIDLDGVFILDLQDPDYQKFKEFIAKELKQSTRVKEFYIDTNEFLDKWSSYSGEERKERKKSSRTSAIISNVSDWRELPFDQEVQFNCTNFPSLSKIYESVKECHQYLEWKGVFVKKEFVRKILLTIQKDKPFVLYGEPGDGKSFLVKHILNWIAYIYNGGILKRSADSTTEKLRSKELRDFKKKFPNLKIPLNPFLKGKVPDFGIEWESKNIDESTSPLSLYGGYSPETISSGSKSMRRKNLEFGIITDGIMNGKYVFLDELNRTDNENLGRLMGFLEEPYNYKLEEGNIKVVLKNPPQIPRSNWILVGTMNIGDVGNFKMSSAFKRRFKIIEIKYSEGEITNIVKKKRLRLNLNTRETQQIMNDLTPILDLSRNVSGGSVFKQILKKKESLVERVTRQIYIETHKWSDTDNLTNYGAGVAHITAVLDDLSLYQFSFFKDEWGDKTINYYLDHFSDFKSNLLKMVNDVIWENVIMALIDENDKYKRQNMKPYIDTMVKQVKTFVESVWTEINIYIKQSAYSEKLSSDKWINMVNRIWDFGRSK